MIKQSIVNDAGYEGYLHCSLIETHFQCHWEKSIWLVCFMVLHLSTMLLKLIFGPGIPHLFQHCCLCKLVLNVIALDSKHFFFPMVVEFLMGSLHKEFTKYKTLNLISVFGSLWNYHKGQVRIGNGYGYKFQQNVGISTSEVTLMTSQCV